MKIAQNPFEQPEIVPSTRADDVEPEAVQVADEFAAWIDHNRPKWSARPLEHYQVRPCKSVRGFMLHLPVTRWRLWYPSVAAAVSFVKTLVPIYEADCHVYDSSGQIRAN